MKAVILQESEHFELTTQNVDNHLLDDEVLLSVYYIDICGTDLHAYVGEQPFFSHPRILGVETGNSVTNVKPEDKGSVNPYISIDSIDQAVQQGKPNCVEHVSVLGVHQDSGMRKFFKFPAKYIHTSDKLSYDKLALVVPMCIGCHAVQWPQITSNDNVLVIRAGTIGLEAIQFAKAAEANVTVIEINQTRLEFCKELFGIACIIHDRKHTEQQLRAIYDGEKPNIVLMRRKIRSR